MIKFKYNIFFFTIMKTNQSVMTDNDDMKICNNIARLNKVKKSSYFLKKKNVWAFLSEL